MGSWIKSLAHVLNPLAMPLASSGLIPVWGVVRHRGRKSGRSFATPIALAATREHFYIPLPWGEGTDWCRNLVAAGDGAVRYRGREYAATDPLVVDATEAERAYPRVIQPLIGLVGIKRFLRLRRQGSAERAA